MSTLLYIKASPRGPRSHSIAVADAFLETYQEKNTGDLVATKNLFEEVLPAFDGPLLQAKYNVIRGLTHDQEQIRAWQGVERLVDELKHCSKLVLAVPMWNYTVPYRLKQYIDLIVQPGISFEADATGVRGLIEDKPVFIACASGGQYPEGTATSALDFQRPYLEAILRLIGLKNICSVRVEGTLAREETVSERRNKAIAEARRMAETF
jgi:FMN-dependent NADH-azoreductase